MQVSPLSLMTRAHGPGSFYVEMLQLSPKLYSSRAPFLGKPEPFYLVSVITKLINVFGSTDSSVENAVGWLKLGK